MDTMKRKQFVKGIEQIAQEGAIQIFQEFNTGMEEIIVGVVGVLQFDVLKYRLENEYNVEIKLEPLPYEHIRWIENEDIDMNKLKGTSDMKKIKDLKGRPASDLGKFLERGYDAGAQSGAYALGIWALGYSHFSESMIKSENRKFYFRASSEKSVIEHYRNSRRFGRCQRKKREAFI